MNDPLDDSDSVTPLDVILQGGRVVLAEDALVHEEPFSLARSEFRAKVRGVSKSMIMIPRRWGWRGWVLHPVISWRLLSHHFLRWFSPYFGIGVLVTSVLLAQRGGVYLAVLVLALAVLSLGLAGYVAEHLHRRAVIASFVFSFLAIQAGMGLGILYALTRSARGLWEPE